MESYISLGETMPFDMINKIARLLLVKWYDNKMVKLPFNCVIFPLTQPQVANKQEQPKN